ncbi:rCG41156, isoform CRA_b [Rattus norvegicus]|uniref:RCG41156, isoform CRA_b n=1 Tax=Rattus norvegicus TaxID=10116 RepID=A6KIP7_RAT|nr:rCG41156, isoform CRA_b [Rattus norvegicus]
MSRRRISCKDLGHADCQGWLYKKKEKGTFLSNKWKKFWVVLKGSSLYWYGNQLAEKADGFVNLPDFTVERASECKKKNAFKINHPQIKTFYFAAENLQEMNMWLNKLGFAVTHKESTTKDEECYSESEQEDPETAVEAPPPPSASATSSPVVHTLASSEASSCRVSENSSTTPESGCLNSLSSDDTSSLNNSQDHLTVPDRASGSRMTDRASEDDEMEKLYKSLEQASLSPLGDRRPSTKKELRKSFVKRCKNPSINEKLHKIRTLNSTLKCKEHDLAMINQLLDDPKLTARKYREWKVMNTLLIQDIYQQQVPQDPEVTPQEIMNPTSSDCVENSL